MRPNQRRDLLKTEWLNFLTDLIQSRPFNNSTHLSIRVVDEGNFLLISALGEFQEYGYLLLDEIKFPTWP